MSLGKLVLFIVVLGFVAGAIYGVIGSFFELPAQEALVSGAVTFSVIVAIILIYMLYAPLRQQS